MGMAASQARLLMITSRQHDVELKAQQLQNAKLQLATQQDEVYEEYQKALDATTLTMQITENGVNSNIPVDYNSLFSINAAHPASVGSNNEGYVLIDNNGRVVVSDEIYEVLQEYESHSSTLSPGQNWNSFANCNGGLDNAYAFAMYMTQGFSNHEPAPTYTWHGISAKLQEVWGNHYHSDPTLVQYVEDAVASLNQMSSKYNNDNHLNPRWVGQNVTSFPTQADFAGYTGAFTTVTYSGRSYRIPKNLKVNQTTGALELNQLVQSENIWPGPQVIDVISQIANGGLWNSFGFANANNTQKGTFDALMNYMFSKYSSEIFTEDLEEENPNCNLSDFNYYVRLYNAIQQHGGHYISISNFDGPTGPASSNSEWLTNMLQSGQLSIETITVNNTGAATCQGVSVASDPNLAYTATSSIDKVALAHAEAEYEHAMKVIDRKEQKIDRELNKIETERSALTKQYDSIKKVSDENIDRTFGIFS